MEHYIVGFGFRPTEAELVGHYLRHKIHGNNWIVDEAIKEVDICCFAPWDLPRLSLYTSTDRLWYFFCRRDATYGNATKQTRQTSWGSWKLTGKGVDIIDVFGCWSQVPGTKIGYKRVLTFISNEPILQQSSEYVIHEFHYSLVPEHESTYVICRLEYKGNDIIFDTPIDHTPMTFVPVNPSDGAVIDQSCQANYEPNNNNLEGVLENRFNENSSFHHTMQEDSGFLNDLPVYNSEYNTFEIGESSNMQAPHQEDDSTHHAYPYGFGAHDDETHIIQNFVTQFQSSHVP